MDLHLGLFLNSIKGGRVFLGLWDNNTSKANKKGQKIQHMVNGGDLKWWLEQLVKLINQQVYNTSMGQTTGMGEGTAGPINGPAFKAHSKLLPEILSQRNFLSKN